MRSSLLALVPKPPLLEWAPSLLLGDVLGEEHRLAFEPEVTERRGELLRRAELPARVHSNTATLGGVVEGW